MEPMAALRRTGEIRARHPARRRTRRAGTLDCSMSRFFKSAAFPILIVVVLAFFAQKLISPARASPRRPTASS